MSNLNIAIVGAGPAGLTLARLLQVSSIPFTVFEADVDTNSRDQGGCIDIHGRGGQMALKEAGLIEEFRKLARAEGEAMKMVKYDGTVALELKDGSMRPKEFQDRPEIDRVKLREMLLNSVKPENVKWNKKLESVRPTSEDPNKYNLHFADAVEGPFDLVVGADGAWSKVRKLLTDEEPFYAGGSIIELWALNADDTKPWLANYVGTGMTAMFDEGRFIIAQRNDVHIRTYAAVRQPENWIKECGIDWTQPESARKALIDGYFSNCGEDLKRIILESNDELVPRKVHMLPIGNKWAPRPGVTVIGDAAHLMSPAAGVGVNLAMVDALFLAKAIIIAGADRAKLYETIKGFEAEMFERSEPWQKKAASGMDHHFRSTGIDERVAMIQGKLAQAGK